MLGIYDALWQTVTNCGVVMNVAVVLAAGKGRRFQGDKTLVPLQGRPVVIHSIERFADHPRIDAIVLVGSEKNLPALTRLASGYPKVRLVVLGGDSRFESSRCGFAAARKLGATLLVFHNGANPGVTDREIGEVIAAAETAGAAGVARPVRSTLRKTKGGVVPRDGLFEMETPQAVKSDLFAAGLAKVTGEPTDDLQVAEMAGVHPDLVHAEPINRKLTFPDDLTLFESSVATGTALRIGIGQDSHPFGDDGVLRLGGISIPGAPQLTGNSDGDAVLHALTNAISSALGGGSLSAFADPLTRQGQTDSAAYLEIILERLREAKGTLINLSITIEAGTPRLEGHFAAMRERLATLCGIAPDRVGITATSGEQLTAFGKGEAIAVFAQVLLKVGDHDH